MAQKKPPAHKPPRSQLTAELNGSLSKEQLEKAARNLEDRPRMLRMIADFAQQWEKDVFASQGGVAGQKWKPFAASHRGRPLQRTGALRAALTGEPRKMKASVQVRAPKYAEYLKSGRYAPKSKTATGRRQGTDGLGGSMPRRNPSPRPPRDRIAILTSALLDGVLPGDGA